MNEISNFVNNYGRETLEAAVAMFTAYLLYANRKRKIESGGFPTLIKSQEDVIARISSELAKSKEEGQSSKNEVKELQYEIDRMAIEIGKLYNTIDAFTDFCEYIPTPTWMKYPNINDEYSTMCFINQAYEIEWGISKSSYEGKSDIDIWPETVAKEFSRHDKEVTKYATTIITQEKVPRIPFKPVSETNQVRSWIIWKFPVIIEKKVFGVGGMAMRCTDENTNN